MANRIGHSINITSFGESHGPFTGAVLDGFPAGFSIDENVISRELERRKPGKSKITSARKEDDKFEIVSGIFEGKTTGAPITILIPNTGQRSSDYDKLKDIYRPGHADRTYAEKYGHRDHRGGGRSSARVTAGWVAAAAIVRDFLEKNYGMKIQSVVSRIGHHSVENIFDTDWSHASENSVSCPNEEIAKKMEDLILQTAEAGDSLGGIISTRVINCPSGLGEPLFDKLNADLAKAIFSINAVKGLEFGSGFAGSARKGSENNDTPGSTRNNDGGITGGISNGQEIRFNTAFKPVSSISAEQKALNVVGDMVDLKIEGRHDPCVVPRAVPIVEAMTALVLADHLMLNLKYKK